MKGLKLGDGKKYLPRKLLLETFSDDLSAKYVVHCHFILRTNSVKNSCWRVAFNDVVNIRMTSHDEKHFLRLPTNRDSMELTSRGRSFLNDYYDLVIPRIQSKRKIELSNSFRKFWNEARKRILSRMHQQTVACSSEVTSGKAYCAPKFLRKLELQQVVETCNKSTTEANESQHPI